MKKEGREFSGCLYFGLMLTKKGPYVIEYNCRFGDPETQVVLPLLKSDLFEIMLKISDKNLKKEDVQFMDKSAACVVMAVSYTHLDVYKRQAIDGAKNAALLALEILAVSDEKIAQKLDDDRAENSKAVLEKNRAVEEKYNK